MLNHTHGGEACEMHNGLEVLSSERREFLGVVEDAADRKGGPIRIRTKSIITKVMPLSHETKTTGNGWAEGDADNYIAKN